jgi:indole-3-glycerol phosphate synthase
MPTVLDSIVEQKRREVAALRARGGNAGRRSEPRRPFALALCREGELTVIAEVKKASPSRGVIRPDFDPEAIARTYHAGGAAALSVLTDETFFQGSLDYLANVRRAVPLPVLRKDFIIDPLQVQQAAAANADALLLIAAILSDGQLSELAACAAACDVEVLVEVHDAGELERVLRLSPTLIGINNRDLRTFTCDIGTTLGLVRAIPRGVTVVSESGIENGNQAAQLLRAGVSAVLVGESLMRLADPGPLIREIVHAGQD